MGLTDRFVKGMHLLIDGDIYLVVNRMYKTQGRQGGLVIMDLKNVADGKVVEKTFKAGTKLEVIDTEYKELQYLYSDDEHAHFMDTKTFENYTMNLTSLGNYQNFLKESDKYVVQFYEGRPISLRENPTVELEVVEAPPAVKGNTATSATKNVTTSTGYKVAVPLFVKKGDVITVNTDTGEYSGRA
jgi:elongation factor P